MICHGETYFTLSLYHPNVPLPVSSPLTGRDLQKFWSVIVQQHPLAATVNVEFHVETGEPKKRLVELTIAEKPTMVRFCVTWLCDHPSHPF